MTQTEAETPLVIQSLRGSGGNARETLILAALAIKRDYPITPQLRVEMVEAAHAIMKESESDRDKLRAIEFLFAVDSKQAELLLALWKAQRVDAGESTENVAVAVMTPDRLAALSQTLANDTPAGT